MFFDRTQKDKDVIQVNMDESADETMKDHCHQSLKCRGHITVTHLHHLAPECAKDCCKHCLMDILWYDAYLFICVMICSCQLIATRPLPAISLLFVRSYHRTGTLSFASIHKCTLHRYWPSASHIFIATNVRDPYNPSQTSL